mmetsp:Transcript_10562/g.25644  ORF Transcript_10562/g.25644 Transcript_10562/m.25644 type:complete len:231 (+) Transcript_10562:461-1153(+)
MWLVWSRPRSRCRRPSSCPPGSHSCSRATENPGREFYSMALPARASLIWLKRAPPRHPHSSSQCHPLTSSASGRAKASGWFALCLRCRVPPSRLSYSSTKSTHCAAVVVLTARASHRGASRLSSSCKCKVSARTTMACWSSGPPMCRGSWTRPFGEGSSAAFTFHCQTSGPGKGFLSFTWARRPTASMTQTSNDSPNALRASLVPTFLWWCATPCLSLSESADPPHTSNG